ncbi:Bromodomain-containing protein [Heliocybe sulcata]|uniref:Bromodomain-containing protein n=1 Tax=Heliocybe sulcata TaxID=5364 RepID=A0A5C3NKL8_9AGAM|nr:Bromodomain-containing protein [Heliocybe sulcata]
MNAALSDNTNNQTLSFTDDSVESHPDAQSPATPVSHVTGVADKIDIDSAAVESDARHEPAPRVDDASTRPQNGSPQAPESIPIDPPKGTPPPATGELLDDVKMAEQASPNGMTEHTTPNGTADQAAPNGFAKEEEDVKVDVEMEGETPTPLNGDAAHSPISIPTGSSTTAVDSARVPDDRDEDEPPAKRARKFSDADKASVNHSATPPPASTTSSIVNGVTSPQHQGPSTFSLQQHRFCVSTVRTLKKLKDAAPFLKPVDIVALNIPHYPSIIKHPMDFETISNKLAASNPAKPDLNSTSPRYHNADEFVADVRSMFRNCETFNGPDHVIAAMGKRVEGVFDKQIKQMPPPGEPKQTIAKKPSPIPPPAPPASAKKATRRPSTSVPAIRRSEESLNPRPKRDIHPPPPRDLPYADGPKRPRKTKSGRDDGTADQLKYCSKILTELHRKQHYNIASPFYEPVDWVKLDIPAYPKIIKKPMDMSTMRSKLDLRKYRSAKEFRDDFKLMINNCYTFNPVGTPVNQAGVELDRYFDEKWSLLPPLRDGSDVEDEEEDETDDERARAIAEMENQIETMRANLAGLKAKPQKEKKKEKKREKLAPVASSSKASSKPPKQGGSSKKKSNKKTLPDDDVLSFEQKKDLSETIQKLDGSKLEKVIQIIHEGVPEIRDSTEEIELEIDLLPAAVLTKLYNFVLRPLQRNAAPKRSRTGKGTGTGGLKRKSMDEDVETEKIRQLEERMRLFEQGGAANVSGAVPRADMSEHSSDSSDGSDSSGSDSE